MVASKDVRQRDRHHRGVGENHADRDGKQDGWSAHFADETSGCALCARLKNVNLQARAGDASPPVVPYRSSSRPAARRTWAISKLSAREISPPSPVLHAELAADPFRLGFPLALLLALRDLVQILVIRVHVAS